MALTLLTMGLAALAVPGLISPPVEHERPSDLRVQQPYITATDVGGETVTLSLSARLEHRGGAADNTTVVTRAIDTETGLVETTEQVSLGTVDGDRDVPYTTNLTVERAGGYRIETEVFADEQLRTTHTGTVSRLDALTPESARSPVEFHDFDDSSAGFGAIAYRIEAVAANQSTLNVTAYLTNTGDEAAGNVELQLRARQADSNVVADSSTTTVGEIRPGRTRPVSTELAVPDGYDYWLDGILSSDGVIVATERAVADLDPTETIGANQTTRESGFQSGDFVQATETPDLGDRAADDDRATASGGSGPGFTAGAVLLAVVVALVAIRRDP